jgi:hypothetical protein
MNRFVLVISLAIFTFSGCSKQSAETAKAGSNSQAVNTAPANGNTQVIVPQPASADANQNVGMGVIETPKLPKKLASNSAAGSIPVQTGRPAPDDSTFTSTLTDVGRETRIFRKHPQLLKVEKVIEIGKQSVKVYLRSGRVIDLPGEKIPNLSTIPASEILQIAGVAATDSPRKIIKKEDQ